MSNINSNNIITGSALFYVAPLGTALPTLPATQGGSVVLDGAWKAAGSTDAGLDFAYSPTFKNITVDESMSPVKVIKTAEEVMVTTSLAEATIDNFNLAINGATVSSTAAGAGTAGSKRITVGGSQLYTEYALLIIGPGPVIPASGQNPAYVTTRFFHMYRTFSTAKIKSSFKKDDKVMIPMEFTGLCDTSRPDGDQLFEILEKTGNATS